MLPINSVRNLLAAGLAVAAALGIALANDRPGESPERDSPPTAVERPEPVSLERARERAALMHKVYAATLVAVHEHYFEGCRGVAPARAMKDIFREVEEDAGVQAHWISASFKAMNIGHEPRTDFEKRASRELARGGGPVETIDDGLYRRAEGVPFHGSCISCHSENFGSTSPRRKYAGLIVSVPVTADSPLPAKSE